jgi:2-polyprenyl-6-hydroxyphenyl methylase/3-demethylubiquinone-9 3-methyltransferase
MIEMAQGRTKDHPQREQMRFEVASGDFGGTLEHLSNTAGSLDGILCSSVLEYMPDAERLVDEFARVLKPGGCLLISVPNKQSVVRRAQVAFYRLGRRLRRPWLSFIEYSCNEYSASEFNALLAAKKFRTERVIVFGSPIPGSMQRWRLGGSLLMFAAIRT